MIGPNGVRASIFLRRPRMTDNRRCDPATAVSAVAAVTPVPYNDVYMRKALDDNGTVPYSGATWTWSPDIVPMGANVLSDPGTTLTDNYGTDPGQSTTIGQPNYFSVRGKNLYDSGDLRAVLLPGGQSFDLPAPAAHDRQPKV